MKSSRALIAGLVVMSLVVIGLTVTLVLVLMGDGNDDGKATDKASATPSSEEPTSRLRPVWLICSEGDDTVSIGDDDTSLIIDTGSEYGSIDGIDCVLQELGTSDALVAQMDSTTAMMGVQTAEEDGLSYRWSYHPDNGVNMTITEQ